MKKSNNSFITLIIILAIVILAGVVTYMVQQSAIKKETGRDSESTLITSDETPYTDLNGDSFSFDSYTGKVRVVNAWASWCPFCVEELKDFEELAAMYPDTEVVVIAVNRKESKEKAAAFLNTLGSFEHTVFAIDLTDAFYKSIGGFSMPETVFYDANGDIVLHKRGFMSLEEMKQHTQAALAATK